MQTKPAITIFWFRRDLRLEDNIGLTKALKSNSQVLPLFIFDTNLLEGLPKTDARVSFIFQRVKWLKQEFRKYNSDLLIETGTPERVFKKLFLNYHVNALHTNRDYEPYAQNRDSKIEAICGAHACKFITHKDHVIFEPQDILKKDASPYLVYTPYSKRWLSEINQSHLNTSKTTNWNNLLSPFHSKEITLETLNFKESPQTVKPINLSNAFLENYTSTRNFPSNNKGTSWLSPHIRFGTISIRKVVSFALKHQDQTFVKELIWREFFQNILWHFPHTQTQAFKPVYDTIKWQNNPKDFLNWKLGQTGYPLVDAGMRQLNQTGYMHNRVRMVTASFLCKHLLIDWRWGEAYFAEKLLDYEMASNIGNWQWVAGCGVDAAPYFRIFNPITQLEKFDPTHAYVSYWIPELQTNTYPKQIVEHPEARKRCLAVYQAALKNK